MADRIARLRELADRLAGTFRQGRSDADLQDELRSHLEMAADAARRGGAPVEEAVRTAAIRHGGMAQSVEAERDQRGFTWVTDLQRDVQHGWRQLVRNPGFTTVAVLSLALGIGANTALFSIANEFLFRPLPVKNPSELVRFTWRPGSDDAVPRGVRDPDSALDRDYRGREPRTQSFSLRAFERFRDEQTLLRDVFAVGPLYGGTAVTIDGQSESIDFAVVVSGNYFSALGVPAFRGRTIMPADDRPGAPPVAVISHRFWQARFGGDPSAIGKTLVAWGKLPVTIIGVTPQNFTGTLMAAGTADITLPLALASSVHKDDDVLKPDWWWLQIMGRLGPGTTADQVRLGYEGPFQAAVREGFAKSDPPPRLDVISGAPRYSEQEHAEAVGVLLLPTGMVVLILAAACANVASLLLARSATRRREVGVRLALGASRWRVVRQLLTESTMLALLGAALGLLFAGWSLDAAQTLGFPRPVGLDLRVLGFTITLGLLTGVVFGLAPALRSTRLDLTAEFQGGSRSTGELSRLSRTLIVVQVAVSCVLLVGTGLLLRTVSNLRAVDIGFESAHLVSFDVTPSGYPREQFGLFYDRVLEQIRALPGVRSVTFATLPPFNSGRRARLSIASQTTPSGQGEDVALNQAGPSFFETFGMPILIGRTFGPGDVATAPKVAIVNESLAKKYFEDRSPIGQRIRLEARNGGRRLDAVEREIVGVARDAKQQDLRSPASPVVHLPFAQDPPLQVGAAVIVRTAGDPATIIPALRRTVSQVNPNVPLPTPDTGTERREQFVKNQRVFGALSGLLGLLALGLASVGLYGLLSYVVLSRTREIGLRMALGAAPRSMLWGVVRRSLALVGIGIFMGVIGAAAASQLIATMLYGLSTVDPLTYGAVTLLVGSVALLASWLPARRAARVDPVIALRSE